MPPCPLWRLPFVATHNCQTRSLAQSPQYSRHVDIPESVAKCLHIANRTTVTVRVLDPEQASLMVGALSRLHCAQVHYEAFPPFH